MRSRLYEGTVVHRRYQPRQHHFRYPLAMLYLDLDETSEVFSHSRWWSMNRPNVAWLRREDYFGSPDVPLQEAISTHVQVQTGRQVDRVALLTHPRYFGYAFNPVSFYYCFEGETLGAIAAEITNTPWGERHCYVLDRLSQGPASPPQSDFSFDKAFHVSPFNPMDQRYHWRLGEPQAALEIGMANYEGDRLVFSAGMSLSQRPITAHELNRVLWKFPAQSARIKAAIYWQALRLRLKGAPFYPHPNRDSSPGKEEASS